MALAVLFNKASLFTIHCAAPRRTQLKKMKTYIISPGNIPEEISLHGLLCDLTRLPRDVAHSVSPNVEELSLCTAGGRLRFATDSPSLSVSVTLAHPNLNVACDVVVDGVLVASERCPEDKCELSFNTKLPQDKKLHCVTVFLPRTAPVSEVTLSLPEDAAVRSAEPYRLPDPVVYYGSSITMGASVAAPSRCYTALTSELLCADHVNLGFGGSAKGEREMAEYIASLKMTAFVMDYEHNADTLEYLRDTHKPFFDIIRRAQPTLPILIVSRPDTDREFLRSALGRRIVMDTFHAALESGDRYVDYVDGHYLFGDTDRHLCTADDEVHPTELGFHRMTSVIAPRLRSLIERGGASDGEHVPDSVHPTHL